MDKILIKGLELKAKHGVLDAEKMLPQKFIFDIKMFVNFEKAKINDDITATVSYAEVVDFVESFTKANTFNLIESLAYKVGEGILDEFPLVQKISIKLSKPNAPIGQSFKTVAVKVKLTREMIFKL